MPSRAELAGHAERRSHCRHSMVLVEPDEPMRRAANVWTIKLGIAAPNLYAREIWVPVLRNLDTTDIGENIGGDVVRQLMDEGDKRLVVIDAFGGNARTPRVNRGATLGANDHVQFYLIGRVKAADRRNLATERHLHLTRGFISEKCDRNIGDLKSRIVRTGVPAPRELLSLLHRFLEASAGWCDFKDHWPLKCHRLRPGIRLRLWGCLRMDWKRNKSREGCECGTTGKNGNHVLFPQAPNEWKRPRARVRSGIVRGTVL